MTLLAVTHLACAAAFAGLGGLIVAAKPDNRIAWLALLACALTALWAGMIALGGYAPVRFVPLAETLRTVAWLALALAMLIAGSGESKMLRRWIVPLGVCAALALLGDVFVLFLPPEDAFLGAYQVYARIGLAVFGLVLVENVYRNSAKDARWAIAPICVALGGMFAFNLLVYSDAILLRRIDPLLVAARALTYVLAVPPIIVGIARNRTWRINIHVSRQAVLYTASCICSGTFLLSVAIVGTLLRPYAGDWGAVIQLSLVFGCLLLIGMLITSGTIRSWLRQVIAQNFFSHRYDYRIEWAKFIEALSTADDSNIEERVIKAIADIVESPAGALWLLGEGTFQPVAVWNLRLPNNAKEQLHSPFVQSFDGGARINELDLSQSSLVPDWASSSGLWLAIPLPHQGGIIGFVVLGKSRAPFRIDTEVRELLAIVSRQAASYLSEAYAARTLADTKLLGDYGKRFAFAIHDIKNLVSQLSLVLSNAKKFGSDPEFHEDVIHTIHSSVERLNKLLLQLKTVETSRNRAFKTDVAQVAREVTASVRPGARVLTALPGETQYASIDPTALHSAITHLLNNALDVSGETGTVTIEVQRAGDNVTIDVCDQGPGMEMAFIRNELFRPFRTTKTSGYGIGAFQVRELARAAGGDLEVISTPGVGTIMRLVVPVASHDHAHTIEVA